MLKRDVHAHFGTLQKIAQAVGISKQGVWMWPKVVPQGHAYKLQILTGGVLQVDPGLYAKRHLTKKRKGRPSVRLPASAKAARVREMK